MARPTSRSPLDPVPEQSRDPHRPTVVLIHAFPLHAAMWEPQRRALAEHAYLYLPDLPGFGTQPGLDEEGFSMQRAALFIQRQLESRGIRKCILGGLSMGGYVAFQCWKMFPERISGLILADTKASADDEEAKKNRFAAMEKIGSGGYARFCEDMLTKLLSERTRNERQDIVDAVRGIMHSSPPETAVAALLGMASRPDSTDMLATITVPTAVIVGEEDVITKVEESRKMVALIPDSTLHVIPGAGHLSNIDNPSEFNSAVVALVERCVQEPA